MPGTPPLSPRLLIPRITNPDASDPATHMNGIADRVDVAARKIETRVTTLPASPQDGDVIAYSTTAMSALGVVWRLRYRAAAPAGRRWEYIGGPEMYGQNTGSHSLN